jgi:hypothetical protein
MMRFVRRAVPVVLVLLAACAPKAEAPSAAAKSELDEIIDSNLAARGGREKIQALRSIRETGTATASGGRIARISRELQRPGSFRLEFTFQGTTSVFANDGAKGWQVAPLQGQFEPKEMPLDVDAAAGVDQRDIEGPLVDWKAKGHQVELVGREKLAGGEAFKLKVTLRGGAVRYDYVDVASRQIVRSEFTRLLRGRATLLENEFSDFREVGGLTFPHTIQMRVKDRPQQIRIVVQKIELDPELDAARFRLPA